MTKLQADAMTRLCVALEHLPPWLFDFVGFECGTTACAIGWARRWFCPHYRGLYVALAQTLLGVPYWQFDYLFAPYASGLGPNATARQVAAHLRTWLVRQEVSS
jgi:hypothetical protein